MQKTSNKNKTDESTIFDIKNEPMPKGAWWWWFWLFFFNNPKDKKKSKQLMILWSTKNVKEIDCNNLKIKLNHTNSRENLDGAVASWYFDGEKMHHNFLLEQCVLKISANELSSISKIPTSFSINKNKHAVKIGDNIEFIAEAENKHDFTTISYNANKYFGNLGYSIIKINHLNLTGIVDGKKIHGSAYFQRVFVNAPAVPWYWGIFHFENGSALTYFNPHVFGKSLKKHISFFDGKKIHEFKKVTITRNDEIMPTFIISGEDNGKKINFAVSSYSHSSWTFRKKFLGIIPNKLVYNEYPAIISDFKLENGNEKITLENLGSSVGNAEHTIGLLL